MRFLPAQTIFFSCCLFIETVIAEDIIQNNDIIAVTGSVKYCENWGQFVAWRTRVVKNVIEINGHIVNASGISTQTLHDSLSSIMGPTLGTSLIAVQVEVISAAKYSQNRIDLCASGRLILDAIKACEKGIQHFKERKQNKAEVPYNKSLKYVPPALLAPPDAC